MSLCEYDPGCENEATMSVGANGQWRLCDICAALPQFARFRKRKPLRRARSTLASPQQQGDRPVPPHDERQREPS